MKFPISKREMVLSSLGLGRISGIADISGKISGIRPDIRDPVRKNRSGTTLIIMDIQDLNHLDFFGMFSNLLSWSIDIHLKFEEQKNC